MNKPAATVRYDSMIGSQSKSLSLPSKYQRLLWRFEKINEMLNFLNIKGTNSFFAVLQKAIQSSMHE